jgi:hypothetical protein
VTPARPETCCGRLMDVMHQHSAHVTEYHCPICGARRFVGITPDDPIPPEPAEDD